MKTICLVLTFAGAAIIGASILLYYKTMSYMKSQTYDRKVFNSWIHDVSLVLMTFFFLSYLGVGIGMAAALRLEETLVAAILFSSSLFVLFMVRIQQSMSRTISGKTTEIIQAMIEAMEAKDLYTKGHSEHVYNLVGLIYRHLPPSLQIKINPIKLQDAALLHDIGKIGIPDSILNKPDSLTEDEYGVMKQHPGNGAAILEKTCYRDISGWVKFHHERVDGNGYYGLSDEEIPLESKIIAVADTFSALYTSRVYREPAAYERSVHILQKCAGTQLDTHLVNVFCSIGKEEILAASISIAAEQGQSGKLCPPGTV